MPRTPDVPEVIAPPATRADLRAAYDRNERADVELLTVVADAKVALAGQIQAHLESSTPYIKLINDFVNDAELKPDLRLKAAMAMHAVIFGPTGSAPRGPQQADQAGNLIGQLMQLMAPKPGLATDSE